MASDNRSADRNEIDSMTREFLAKGGKIVQCPPGSSDSVVYKRTSFRRRGAPAAGKDEAAGAPAAPNGEAPAGDASTGDASNAAAPNNND
ncbi:hypothetical protein [Azospirillum rugosum]|uniref:Uncharacterized protein n=1 Tax=Azospirillum rugosum TaxID=416170 RepID=A0ABS4SPP8_9PROT|nr:hypothetical protein [Azospirillum rugosum]MBP2294516.1 hypothetical protein [Azospirillum rugosum]MDQ0529021.1 hypothetical protein [Azospirillum rugosum]